MSVFKKLPHYVDIDDSHVCSYLVDKDFDVSSIKNVLIFLKGANDVVLANDFVYKCNITVVACRDVFVDYFEYLGLRTVSSTEFFDGKLDGEKFDLAIGNPPYGKNANLSVKYLNKTKEYSNNICFIVPASFNKPSIINRIDSCLHCVNSIDIPKEEFNVNACYQNWEVSLNKREKIKTFKKHLDFEFVDKEFADIALGRVGGGPCGKVYRNNFQNRSKESHYFIKVKDSATINKLDSLTPLFRESAKQTVSVPSLSKHDIIRIYNGEYNGR